MACSICASPQADLLCFGSGKIELRLCLLHVGLGCEATAVQKCREPHCLLVVCDQDQ